MIKQLNHRQVYYSLKSTRIHAIQHNNNITYITICSYITKRRDIRDYTATGNN